MKNYIPSNKKLIPCLFAILLSLIAFLPEAYAQFPGINELIAKHRKGELIIKANPGDRVSVEQLSHEFWFGCAISNSITGNSWPENDIRQYKEKFLGNFNSDVTENAVKWANMEPRKGEVNYAVADAILKWTEENHIPLRGQQQKLIIILSLRSGGPGSPGEREKTGFFPLRRSMENTK